MAHRRGGPQEGLAERHDPGTEGVSDAPAHLQEARVTSLHLTQLLRGLGLHRLDALPGGLDLTPELALELVDVSHGGPPARGYGSRTRGPLRFPPGRSA